MQPRFCSYIPSILYFSDTTIITHGYLIVTAATVSKFSPYMMLWRWCLHLPPPASTCLHLPARPELTAYTNQDTFSFLKLNMLVASSRAHSRNYHNWKRTPVYVSHLSSTTGREGVRFHVVCLSFHHIRLGGILLSPYNLEGIYYEQRDVSSSMETPEGNC